MDFPLVHFTYIREIVHNWKLWDGSTHISSRKEVEDVVESDTQDTVTVDMNGATVVPGDASNVTLWTVLLMVGLGMLVFVQKKYVR